MTLLAKQPSLDQRLAPVKDIQEPKRATLEFKTWPETFLCISKAISAVSGGPAHNQTVFKCQRCAAPLLFLKIVLATMAHKRLWKGRRMNAVVSKIRID